MPGIGGSDPLSASVLVLNRMFMAVRVINVRRAFTLLYKDLAEVVSIEDGGAYATYDFSTWTEVSQYKKTFEPAEHEWIRTVRLEIAVPRVIRLLGFEKVPRREVRFNRRNIYARDNNRCQYCGRKFPTSELSLDHVIPKSRGGGMTWENVVCACVSCNVRKGGRTPREAGMHLTRKPFKPKSCPTITLRAASPRYRTWKHFLDAAYWNVELRE
ncbi:MAG: HNH endonuclease [Phycisphaerae bacterium]|nr:HNH endonuclease [Phycisphaerae bacterium]